MIEIICTNNNLRKEYKMGTNLLSILDDMKVKLPYRILAAKVNNEIKSLRYEIHKNKNISFIDASDISGYFIYERSLYFILYRAVKELFPNEVVNIKHSISGGKYCEFENCNFKTDEIIAKKIEDKMREIVKADIPFERKEIATQKALQLYEKEGFIYKKALLQHRKKLYTSVYYLGDCINYFYGFLAPSTSYIDVFGIKKYGDGFLLQMPLRNNPNKLENSEPAPKLYSIFKEFDNWNKILGISYVGNVNQAALNGKGKDLLLVSEALQEKKVVQIADKISERENCKIVLLSGPSSSGKTTTAKRIAVQLGVLGYNPIQISMDNYFVERTETPTDKNGKSDYEHFHALDLALFNEQLSDLISGKEIQTPTFNFKEGKKEWKGNKLKIKDNSILIIEGIHALNPELLISIDQNLIFRIFVSALTSLAMDKQNPIHTNDNRLIRRIIRDSKYRGYSARESLSRWTSVRNGEERWVFPYQENADAMFNSAINCELNILKPFALDLLYKVSESDEEYTEAKRLIKMLEYFVEIPEKDVPMSSILREFFGGSVFSY